MSNRLSYVTEGALRAYLAPKLALDAGFRFDPVLKAVDAKHWSSSKRKIVAAVTAGARGKLAQDADITDVIELLDHLDDVAEEVANQSEEPAAKDEDKDDDDDKKAPFGKKDDDDDKKAEDEDEDEDDDDDDNYKKKEAKDRKGAKDKKAAKDRKGAKDKVTAKDETPQPQPEGISKAAMDAAIAAAVTQAEKNTVDRLRAIRDAERMVHPFVGEITTAMDSAEDVYKIALDAAGVDLTGVPPIAYAAMVRMMPKPGQQSQPKSRPAMDAKGNEEFAKRFPGALALKQR